MATEDILINDGDGFISLSELAAEQVGRCVANQFSRWHRHIRLSVCKQLAHRRLNALR